MIKFLEFLQEMFMLESHIGEDENFSDGALSKDRARELAKKSSLKDHYIANVEVIATHHAAARALQRQPDKNRNDWLSFSQNIVRHMKNHPDLVGEYLVKSKSQKHSVVANLSPKQIRYITVLPTGKSLPRLGTDKVVVESIQQYIEIEIE